MVTPTETEEALQMSLPADIRELSVEEVTSGQSIPPRFRTGGGGGSQPDAPTDFGDPTLQTQAQPSDLDGTAIGGTGSQPDIPLRPPSGAGSEPDLSELHRQAGFSQAQIDALRRRAELKVVAERRGKGFTRLEAERFLGGGTGVSALRSDTRSGGKIDSFVTEAKQKVKDIAQEVKQTFGDFRLFPKKDVAGTREVFNRQTGQFEAIKDDPQLGKGTREIISTRLPTTEEQRRFNVLESFAITADTEKIKKDAEKLDKLNLDRNELVIKQNKLIEGKVNEAGEFTGTDKQFNEIQKISSKISIAEQKIGTIKPTRTSSFFNFQREVPVQRLAKPFAQINVISETIAKATGEVASKLGKEGGIINIQEQQATILEPQFGTQQVDPLTGQNIPFLKPIEVTVPERQIGTPEQFRKVGETGVTFGKFFVPVVGTGLFVSEVGEFGADVSKTIKSGEELTKQQKVGIGLTGAVLLGGGAFVGTRFIRKSVVIPEAGNVLRISSRGQEFFGTKIRLSQKGFQVLPSKRGIIIERQVIKKPRADLKATETIGKDILEVSEKGTREFVLFPKQKLSQLSTEGSKVVITKNGKVIFEGNPFTIKGKKQRKEVFELLEKKGFSKKDISELIKLQQPVAIDQTLKGNLFIKKKGAIGKFESIREQPVIPLDGGIKTRGGKPIKTDIFVERRPIKVGDKKFILEEKGTQTFIKKREGKGIKITEEREVSRGLVFGKESPTFKGSEVIKSDGLLIFKEAQLKRISGVTVESPLLLRELRIDSSKTLLIKKEIEEAKRLGFQGGGKKSSQEFFEQLYFPQELKVVPTIKTTIPKTTKVKEIGLEISKQELPLMVGGTGLKQVSFTGTGLFERTEGVGVSPVLLGTQVQPSLIQSTQVNVFDQPVKVKTKQISGTGSVVDVVQKKALDTTQKIKQREAVKEVQVEVQVPRLIQTFQQRLQQEQRARQQIRQKTKQQQQVQQPRLILSPLLRTALTKVKQIAKDKPEKFEAFAKSFGQDISLGTFKTKKKAETELSKFLKGTLSASGFLEEDGKKIKAKETNLLKDPSFRKGLLSEFSIVERRPKRLRRGGTGKQIQFFRGRGKSRSLFNI